MGNSKYKVAQEERGGVQHTSRKRDRKMPIALSWTERPAAGGLRQVASWPITKFSQSRFSFYGEYIIYLAQVSVLALSSNNCSLSPIASIKAKNNEAATFYLSRPFSIYDFFPLQF